MSRFKHLLLRLLLLLVVVLVTCATGQAQTIKVRLMARLCNDGKIYNADVSIGMFDLEKVPKITKTVAAIEKNLAVLNSNVAAAQNASTLIDQLHDLVAKTPGLAKVKHLPRSGQLFQIPAVRKVIVVAFVDGESDPFPYASKEVEISIEHMNSVTINYPTDDACKDAH